MFWLVALYGELVSTVGCIWRWTRHSHTKIHKRLVAIQTSILYSNLHLGVRSQCLVRGAGRAGAAVVDCARLPDGAGALCARFSSDCLQYFVGFRCREGTHASCKSADTLRNTLSSQTVDMLCDIHSNTTILPQGALILLPLGDVPPRWAARILRFSITSAVKFFPMRLIMQDEAALQKRGGKYIVGGSQMLQICHSRPAVRRVEHADLRQALA